jgi:hypothetical protein
LLRIPRMRRCRHTGVSPIRCRPKSPHPSPLPSDGRGEPIRAVVSDFTRDVLVRSLCFGGLLS